MFKGPYVLEKILKKTIPALLVFNSSSMWFNSQIDQISGSRFKSCLRASLRKINNFGDD